MSYAVTQPVGDVRSELLALWCRNFPGEWDRWYDWMCLDNPYGEVTNWFIETSEGQRIGSTGLLPRMMWVDGEERIVGQAIHINVDKDHRTALPALKLQRALIDTARELDMPLVCGVTKDAVAVFRRAGYKMLGVFSRWVKPMRSDYFVKRRIGWRPARWSAARMVDLGLKLRSADTFLRPKPSWSITAEDEFDSRFDRLWERVRSQHTFLGDRSCAFLRWRLRKQPKSDHHVMTLSDSRDDLLGYLVYCFEDVESTRFAVISDLLYANDEAAAQLLAAFCTTMRGRGVEAIGMNYLGHTRLTDILRRFGFHQRNEKLTVLVYLNPNDSSLDADTVLDVQNWYWTDAELDF